jgi:hypothetical protein
MKANTFVRTNLKSIPSGRASLLMYHRGPLQVLGHVMMCVTDFLLYPHTSCLWKSSRDMGHRGQEWILLIRDPTSILAVGSNRVFLLSKQFLEICDRLHTWSRSISHGRADPPMPSLNRRHIVCRQYIKQSPLWKCRDQESTPAIISDESDG